MARIIIISFLVFCLAVSIKFGLETARCQQEAKEEESNIQEESSIEKGFKKTKRSLSIHRDDWRRSGRFRLFETTALRPDLELRSGGQMLGNGGGFNGSKSSPSGAGLRDFKESEPAGSQLENAPLVVPVDGKKIITYQSSHQDELLRRVVGKDKNDLYSSFMGQAKQLAMMRRKSRPANRRPAADEARLTALTSAAYLPAAAEYSPQFVDTHGHMDAEDSKSKGSDDMQAHHVMDGECSSRDTLSGNSGQEGLKKDKRIGKSRQTNSIPYRRRMEESADTTRERIKTGSNSSELARSEDSSANCVTSKNNWQQEDSMEGSNLRSGGDYGRLINSGSSHTITQSMRQPAGVWNKLILLFRGSRKMYLQEKFDALRAGRNLTNPQSIPLKMRSQIPYKLMKFMHFG